MSTTDIIASGGGADTATDPPVPVSITWYLCQQCNQAFNLREKLNFHTQMSHRVNAELKADQPQDIIQGGTNNENSSQSNLSIENAPDEGEDVLLSLSQSQTVVVSTNTNEVNFHSVVNEKHDSNLSSKMTEAESETEIMARAAVSELEKEMSEECTLQIVNNKCDDTTSVLIETEIGQCSSSENYSGDSISLLTSHPPPLELEVEKSEPQPPIVAENTTLTETTSPGPVEVETSTNRKPRTTKPVIKYQTRASLRLKRMSAKEVLNATMTMTQSVAEYTPGNSGNFGLGGTLDVNVEVKDSNHSNSLDILAPTVVTRHQLDLALSALISDSSPPQQQLQLLPRRLAADTTRVSRKRSNKSKPRCKYGKKRQLARFRNRNRVQPTTPFPALKRIKITKKMGPNWQAMTTPLVKVKANEAEANVLATSNSANYNDESYRKFKEELLTTCSLCDKDVPMSSFVLHVKYCRSPKGANQYNSSSNKGEEEPSYQTASSPTGSDLNLKTPVAEAEIRSLQRRNRNKNCTNDKNVTPWGHKIGAKLKPKLNSTLCTVAAPRYGVLNNNEGILSSTYQNKAANITDSSYGNIHDINYKFQCDICPRTFSTKTGLGLHKNAHSSQRNPRRSNTLQQHNSTQVNNRQFHPDPFQWRHQCPECGHRFFIKSHLQKHVHMKHRDISIKMDATVKREGEGSCLEKMLNENTDADVTNIGTTSSSFKCNYCPRTFRTLNFLTMHKYSHAEYSGYGCSICNIGFKNSARAEIHSRLHTGERPFVCNINNCSETFISNSFLEQHMRRNHGHGPTSHSKLRRMTFKNFPCSLCPKNFVSKPSLRQHLMVHSDERKFKCPYEECTATYKTSQCFIEHLRLHTGETPYKCEICGRQYARQGSFRVHQRSHTDDYNKRYQCQICDYYSRSNWALQNHSMMVHQELRIHSVLFKRN